MADFTKRFKSHTKLPNCMSIKYNLLSRTNDENIRDRVLDILKNEYPQELYYNLCNNLSNAFLALKDNKLVGFIHIFDQRYSRNDNNFLSSDAIYVEKPYRKQGNGVNLQLKLHEWAAKQGYESLRPATPTPEVLGLFRKAEMLDRQESHVNCYIYYINPPQIDVRVFFNHP